MLQLNYNGRTDGITQSLLSGFLKCRVFSKLSLEGWTSLKTGAALQFGEMAHGVLETVYREVEEDGRESAPEKKEVYKYIAAQAEAWEESPRGSRAGRDEIQQLEQNIALLEAVLPYYFRFWGKEDFGSVKWVALEKEFKLPLEIPGLGPVILRGKIDGLYRNPQKRLRLFETKTKGRIEEANISDLLAFDFQTDFYGIAAESLYGELPGGARYNIIRRPGQKLGKKGESLSAYRARVEGEVVADPKHYFIRYQIDKSKKDAETFRRELNLKIKDFIGWLDGKIPTYRNETACMDKFGPCRFLRICASGNYSSFYKRKHLFEELSNGNAKEA